MNKILDRSELLNQKPSIDISGPDGDAFVIISTARQIATQLSSLIPNIDEIIDEMESGDYSNLVEVFVREFGEYIDIYR